jgi:hypothetical protein
VFLFVHIRVAKLSRRTSATTLIDCHWPSAEVGSQPRPLLGRGCVDGARDEQRGAEIKGSRAARIADIAYLIPWRTPPRLSSCSHSCGQRERPGPTARSACFVPGRQAGPTRAGRSILSQANQRPRERIYVALLVQSQQPAARGSLRIMAFLSLCEETRWIEEADATAPDEA